MKIDWLGLFYLGISLATLVALIVVTFVSYRQERKYELFGKGDK